MGTYTKYLQLYKPAANDYYNVETDQNENFDKIDEKFGKVDNGLNKKLNKGTYEGDADDLKREIDGKEPAFSKKSGFNLDKSDSVSSNSSNVLATSLAVKTSYDKASNAEKIANTKEPAFSKKSGFNLEKTSDYKSADTNKVFTQQGANSLYKEVEKDIKDIDLSGKLDKGGYSGTANDLSKTLNVAYSKACYKNEIKIGTNSFNSIYDFFAKEKIDNDYHSLVYAPMNSTNDMARLFGDKDYPLEMVPMYYGIYGLKAYIHSGGAVNGFVSSWNNGDNKVLLYERIMFGPMGGNTQIPHIQSPNTKRAGFIYLDVTSNSMYYCFKDAPASVTTPSSDYFYDCSYNKVMERKPCLQVSNGTVHSNDRIWAESISATKKVIKFSETGTYIINCNAYIPGKDGNYINIYLNSKHIAQALSFSGDLGTSAVFRVTNLNDYITIEFKEQNQVNKVDTYTISVAKI